MKRKIRVIEHAEANAPLRLCVAAQLAFPDGSMTAAGLRKERQRGRLVVERIAGKDYTTLAFIEEMRKRCRLEAEGRASTCGAPGRMVQDATPLSGPSVTEATERARAALHMILQEPSEPLAATSRPSTPRPSAKATVTPTKSRSPPS